MSPGHLQGSPASARAGSRCWRCWFDQTKCARGLDALKLYRAEYDDKLMALRPHPVHDWTSHAADSFRYLAMTLDGPAAQSGFHRRIEYSRQGVV